FTLPSEASFSYLGIPIKPGGLIDTAALINLNTKKARSSMNQISSLGVNHKGFNRLLSVRFYRQMIRSQMEYGLAICVLNNSHFKKLEACQNECIRCIFSDSARSSTKVMLHLVQQPFMTARAIILQAEYLIRSMQLPDDTLLNKLLPHLQIECVPILDELDRKVFKRLCLRFQKTQYENLCQGLNSKLIRACRPNMIIDPILWLPMTNTERSQVIRWRLGWLPGDIPRPSKTLTGCGSLDNPLANYLYHPT
ncbi:uncharacterized protein BX663DRAFT_492042, partial [Cokeromyces recurvatus]|uniref:uncharacterized protein n=1 Tax=Cokeromyces recurvatus TaxID=90255 RepID=UPI0022202014